MKSLLESGMTDYRKILFLTFSILLLTSSVSIAYAQDEPKTYPNYRAYDYDGNTVRLSDLEGQVVLLNVWATWCMECLEEMPYLNGLHEEYSQSGLKTLLHFLSFTERLRVHLRYDFECFLNSFLI